MSLVLIDNYDSFVWNLWRYCAELGVSAQVVRNDVVSSNEILSWNPDGIILSPGPCGPETAGICVDLIKKTAGHVPILGVCLGHQAMGYAFGARIVQTPPAHGKASLTHNTGKGLFKNLPRSFRVARYHSLSVDSNALPSCLDITAWTADGLIMGLSHKEDPIHGVQFHPESIASEHGYGILKNFLTLTGHIQHEKVA